MLEYEPVVTINGELLTDGQVMTIRVAINSFLTEIQLPDSLGNDSHGRAMVLKYKKCGKEILNKFYKHELGI